MTTRPMGEGVYLVGRFPGAGACARPDLAVGHQRVNTWLIAVTPSAYLNLRQFVSDLCVSAPLR